MNSPDQYPTPAPRISTERSAGLVPPQEGAKPMPQPYEKREEFYANKPMPEQFPYDPSLG